LLDAFRPHSDCRPRRTCRQVVKECLPVCVHEGSRDGDGAQSGMKASEQAIGVESGTASATAGFHASRRMPIVVTGHVDHGKSTIVGRLLADTGSLPEGKLEFVRANCERNSKPFEYAFLLDALKDEQTQGITIDSARVFFSSAHRHYILVDAPGHVEFLKNMVTGAARAEAALLVIDAQEGVRENSRRHGYLLSMLGVRQIAVLINKMDLVGYDQAVFDRLTAEYLAFLKQLRVEPARFIPVSGFHGDNIATHSRAMPWYRGPTVLEALDEFVAEAPPVDQPFRMPVQGVYKFTGQNDDRRIVCGSIETGRIRPGDEIAFYPSGKRGRIRTIEAFNGPAPPEAVAPQATGFTLEEQIYVTRGELAVRVGERQPLVTTRIRVNLFWLGRSPLIPRKEYLMRHGTARVPARVETVHRVINAAELTFSEAVQRVDRHEVAECTLSLGKPLAFDLAEDFSSTGRFVLVDNYDISGGGVIREALPDSQGWVRDKVLQRNLKWSAGGVPEERRAERFSQRAALLLITGNRETDRKRLGRELETRLFDEGRMVYFLAIGNVLYGVDADLDHTDDSRGEHVRRLGEVANILMDAGLIVIATAVALTQQECDVIGTAVGRERVSAVWVGDTVTTDIAADMVLGEQAATEDGVKHLKTLLQDSGVIFRPW
jgi:bifunctional enzyme CysN/CysC